MNKSTAEITLGFWRLQESYAIHDLAISAKGEIIRNHIDSEQDGHNWALYQFEDGSCLLNTDSHEACYESIRQFDAEDQSDVRD